MDGGQPAVMGRQPASRTSLAWADKKRWRYEEDPAATVDIAVGETAVVFPMTTLIPLPSLRRGEEREGIPRSPYRTERNRARACDQNRRGAL